jgi:acyl-coenzyme A synthetase/AMP-(fatty) acid ligase
MWRIAAPNSAIINLYGPTEATVFCLAQRVGVPHPLTPGRDFMSIGFPMVGSEAAVLDGQGVEVPDGAQGELALAGVQLADGYLNAPELTARKFPVIGGKRWYLTGDLAMRDPTGAFHCLGRIDNQVKILGHRIELEEVDAHLRDVTNALMVGTVAWPLANGGAQGLVGFVGMRGIDDAQVRAVLKTRLPAYMVPSRVVALEHMPLNQSGKVDRNALRQLLAKEVA